MRSLFHARISGLCYKQAGDALFLAVIPARDAEPITVIAQSINGAPTRYCVGKMVGIDARGIELGDGFIRAEFSAYTSADVFIGEELDFGALVEHARLHAPNCPVLVECIFIDRCTNEEE